MDDTELHYLTYDPDALWNEMVAAYVTAGGDVLYPGDEKEMLLRGMQYILFLAFAGVDNALRMDTLRYTLGEYMDLYGQKRSCYRMEAAAAKATVTITFRAGESGTIPKGTALTADGEVLYLLTEDVTYTGDAQTVTAQVQCSKTGETGNGLLAGTEMQFLVPQDGVTSVYCAASAAGGQGKETDEAYRGRIRAFGLSNVTTGTKSSYESAAKAVSSQIIDARALNLDDGVGVYILAASETGLSALLEAVEEALNDTTARPLTDHLTVAAATAVSYTLNVKYSYDGSAKTQAQITDAVSEYQVWQDKTIGRAFNPDKLMAMLYQAGATRVLWDTGSTFDGGEAEYTEIEANEHCSGNINLAVIST